MAAIKVDDDLSPVVGGSPTTTVHAASAAASNGSTAYHATQAKSGDLGPDFFPNGINLDNCPVYNNVFGLVVPGRPVMLDFRMTAQQRFISTICSPANISQISLFLNPGQALPADQGELQSVGQVVLGLAVMPLDSVSSLAATLDVEAGGQLGFARLVAMNLFRFMESFAKQLPGGEGLVVPTGVLEQWFKRFEDKWKRDPSFLLGSTASSSVKNC